MVLFGAIAAVIVLAVAGGGVLWWWSHRASEQSAGPVPGQLTKEFPTAPSVAWKVDADQFGASAFLLSTPVGDGYYAFPPALVDDGGVAIAVPGPGNGTNTKPILAGVNMATGKPWTTQVEANCPEQIVGHLVACSTWTNEQQQFAFVDVRNGTKSGTAEVPKGKGGVAAFDGQAVYLTGGDTNGSQMRVTKIDRSGREVWSVRPDVPILPGPGFARTAVGRGLVGASVDGTAVLSTRDGHLVSKNVGAGQVLADGSLVGAAGPSGSGMPSGFEVVHPNGTTTQLPALENPLNGSYGPTQQQPAITSRKLAGIAVVGGRLYRPGASASTWSAATWISRVVLVTDRITVGVTDKGALQGYETSTGRTVWTGTDGTVEPKTSKFTDSVISDGIRVIALADDGTITATDAATGAVDWKMQGPAPTVAASYNHMGSDARYAYLYPAGDKFVVVTGDSITAYGATGGAAHEPGFSTGEKGATTDHGGSGGYYTRCGTAPVFTPHKFRTASGGLVVTLKVTAKCPGGDVLGAAGTTITIHDDSGVIASGTFDFSSDPIGIAPASGSGSGSGGGGTTVELTFPPGSFWRLPDTLGTGPAGADSSVGTAAKPGILVECERPSGGAQQAASTETSSATASSTYVPSGTDIGGNCSQALRRQADSDRSFIMSTLNGHWLAQLSSKHAGLVADGRTWDDCAILDEFLALRLRFTDVRMLWSDEWSVFSYKGWWVTVAAATFPGPDEANQWCRQQGFDNEHCFAKLISTTAGPDGSTKYWN